MGRSPANREHPLDAHRPIEQMLASMATTSSTLENDTCVMFSYRRWLSACRLYFIQRALTRGDSRRDEPPSCVGFQ